MLRKVARVGGTLEYVEKGIITRGFIEREKSRGESILPCKKATRKDDTNNIN